MPRRLLTSQYLLGVLLLVPVILVGGLAPSQAAPVPKHLMKHRFNHPTAIGTKWVYDLSGGGEQNLLLTKVEEKGGSVLITIESVNADGKNYPHQKLLVSENEWSYAEVGGEVYLTPWCFLKLPQTREHRWETVPTRPDNPNPGKWTALQTANTEPLKLPAGEFNAVKLVAGTSKNDSGDPVGYRYWYASGIGLLKIDEPPYLVLKSFTLGKE